MNFRFYVTFVISSLLLNGSLSAQTYSTNVVHHLPKAVDVNFAELEQYEKDHPKELVPKRPFDEDGDKDSRPPHRPGDPSNVHLIQRNTSRGAETPHYAYLPASPTPTDTFASSHTDGTSVPPDTHGGVDSTYAVSAVNDSVVIRTRTGAFVHGVSLDGFWASMETHGAGAYDPRVHYDPYYKRWIMVADCYGETANSQIMVGVSATGNPTGTWHLYKLVVGTSTVWLDFPCVGFNRRWIAVSGNFFDISGSGGFTNDVIYVFDYASMMSGGTMSYGTLLPTGGSFTACPSQSYDTAEANMFAAETWNGSAGQLRLWKISGAIGAGLAISSVGYPATTTHWQSAPNTTSADFVPQSGSTNKLQGNDDRVNNLVQRNGKLWCAHTAFFPATGTPTRASAMWWQIDSNSTPAQNGIVNDNTNVNFYFFPSIAVNKNNDALIGFAYSSANVHPSCAYALHMNTDPNDSARPVDVYRHGQTVYYQTFGGTQNRWGDFSATCIDPRNQLDFWTLQECSYTSANKWDTWWAYVQICTPPGTPAIAISPISQCVGDTALYAVDTVTGATSYTWTVSGTGWSIFGANNTDSVYLIAGTGNATVSVTANNTCSPGTAYTFTVVPTPLPTEVISAVSLPVCASASTATFSTTATGSPTSYTWSVFGSGWSGSSSVSTLTANISTSTGTIVVNGTNACGTGPNDTLVVIPSSGPATPASITTPTLICTSTSALFTTPAITYATNYTWTITGTGWSGSSTTNSVTATVGTGTATITVSVTDACGTSGDYTTTVTAGAVPSADTAITYTGLLCSGSVVIFTTPVVPGATSYTWTVSGTGWSGTSTTNSIMVTIGTGAGSITVTPVDACGSGTSFTLPSLAAQIPPSATFSISSHTTHVNGNVTVTYTGTGGTGSNYSWNFDGGIATSGTTTHVVHWTTAGTYTVTLTVDSAGCSSTYTDTVHVSVSSGVPQVNSQSLSASIIPNPNEGSFDILFNEPVYQHIKVKIEDMEGRDVYINEFSETINNKIMIVTNGLASGIYIASISTDGVLITKKITVNK